MWLGGGSRIVFRRGCTRLLLYFNTSKPHSFFLQNTSCIRKLQVISVWGGSFAHPLHPPPRSAPGDSTLEIGAAQLPSVTEIAPPQPFLCVKRRSPIRYYFRGGTKGICYGVKIALRRRKSDHVRQFSTSLSAYLANICPFHSPVMVRKHFLSGDLH